MASIGCDVRPLILDHLRRPPFYILCHWPELVADARAMEAFLASFAPQQRLSFTRVQIDAEAAGKPSKATRYSRTEHPLAFHTDAAHARRPHSLVAFAMVRPDRLGGGLSAVVSAVEVAKQLDRETVEALRQPSFDFGRGPMPILWGPEHDPSIRYYRRQLDSRDDTHTAIRPESLEALDKLDAVLGGHFEANTMRLAAGDVLLINNHKALHARTGFVTDSDRLLLRYRLRVRDLE